MKTLYFGEYGDLLDLFQAVNPRHSQVLTIISGIPGAGKSAFATACALENMSQNRKQKFKFQQACDKIDYLNLLYPSANFTKPVQNHLVFVAGYKVEKKKYSASLISYDFDPWRIGMNDPAYATMYFPKNSLRIIDEIQKYFPSQQDSVKTPLRVSTEFQKDRHYGIYSIGTAQVGKNVHNKLREIASFFVVKDLSFKISELGNIVQSRWEVLYFQHHSKYDAYIDNNCNEDFAEKLVFVFNDNILKYYDSKSCEKEFDDISNKFSSYDQSYKEPNSLTPPEGYSSKPNKKYIKNEEDKDAV